MANTVNIPVKERVIFYYRQRLKNRVFNKLVSFINSECEREGISRKDIAARLKKDPSQITRWLSNPSNMTLDSISDLLLSIRAEIEPPEIVRFADRRAQNYAHPLLGRLLGQTESRPPMPHNAETFKNTTVAGSQVVTIQQIDAIPVAA